MIPTPINNININKLTDQTTSNFKLNYNEIFIL